MSTTSQSIHRPIAVLKLPRAVPPLLTAAQAIVRSMTGNPSLPAPAPSLAAVTSAIDDLQAAEGTVLTRAHGAAAARDEKKTKLLSLLQQLLSYVQSQADANLETSASTIESAGMAVKRRGGPPPRVFAALPGRISGSVKLRTRCAGDRASYGWQYSADAGESWVTLPATRQAQTTVSGLTPGSTLAFRYRTVTKVGQGDWSQPVSLIVR